MKPTHWILGLLIVCLAVFWMCTYVPAPNPASLATKALTAPELRDRIDAAATLTIVTSPDPTNQLRAVLEKSQDAEVIVQVLGGLSTRIDYASVPLFIAHLDHPNLTVRAAAYMGLLRFHGGALPEDLSYRVDGTSEEHAQVARRLLDLDRERQAKSLADAAAAKG